MFFFKQGAAFLGAAFTLSNFPLPQLPGTSTGLPPAELDSQQTLQSLFMRSARTQENEPTRVEVSKEQLRAEAAKSTPAGGGVVVDAGGAAWTGRDSRLTDSLSMRLLLPRTGEGLGFHKYGYIGVTTHIQNHTGHRPKKWNSDLGVAIDSKTGAALPFITCGDRTLYMPGASVTIVEYREGQEPLVWKGPLDHSGRYYSFKAASPLREAATFRPGDSVTVKVTRNATETGDGVTLSVETGNKSVRISIPIRSSFLSATRTMTAHKVVSAVHSKGFAPRNCLKAASSLVPRQDLEAFPAMARIARAVGDQQTPAPSGQAGNFTVQIEQSTLPATPFAPDISQTFACSTSMESPLDFCFPALPSHEERIGSRK